MSTNIHSKRQSDSSNPLPNQGYLLKRLVVLLFLTMSLVFAGASTTITNASPCEMKCTEYIDPLDGQCYTRCCPANRECGVRCMIMPCKG
jgi:hypothetical protein